MARIYVGEDSPVEQKLLRMLLQGSHQISFFEDGLDLYHAIFVDRPHLIVTDILLPRLHGLALCRLVRGHGALNGIKILSISSIMEADVAARAREAGADAFLPKPLQVEDFENTLEGLLAN